MAALGCMKAQLYPKLEIRGAMNLCEKKRDEEGPSEGEGGGIGNRDISRGQPEAGGRTIGAIKSRKVMKDQP